MNVVYVMSICQFTMINSCWVGLVHGKDVHMLKYCVCMVLSVPVKCKILPICLLGMIST
jgi:hypothetical protein